MITAYMNTQFIQIFIMKGKKMIKIKVYTNGYEIVGHSLPILCFQISIWHWAGSNLILGLDKEAKEYTSARDNLNNPSEGYSWLIFNPSFTNLKWIFDDLIISLERWVKDTMPKEEVSIEHTDEILKK